MRIFNKPHDNIYTAKLIGKHYNNENMMNPANLQD